MFARYPIRGYRSDINLAGSPKHTLAALNQAVLRIGVDGEAVKERTAKWAEARAKRAEATAARAETGSGETPINKAYFSRELGKQLNDNTILPLRARH